MRILAFQGFRYAGDAARAGAMAAPPFDQIDDRLRDRLHAASPHQFAHLTRPSGEGVAAAEGSRSLHHRWLEDGVVVRDERPSLYPYVIRLADGGRRLGLCCLVGVDAECAGDLRPHEQTVDKPLANRLELLEATRIDYEPVFYLADDDGAFERALAEEVKRLEPVASHRDAARNEDHLLYRLESPLWIQRYQQLLADRGASIADGHHRTKVAQMYARNHGAPVGSPAAAKLAVLTSVTSSGLVIDPIHRALAAPFDLEAGAAAARGRDTAPRDPAALATAVAASPQPALGVLTRNGHAEIWRFDPDDLPVDAPGRTAALSVVFLHHRVLPAVGLPATAASDGTLLYRSNPADIAELLELASAQTAFLLPPMSAGAFAEATADGSVLPPKSTRFLPKLVSGLVWCGHDAATA